MRTAAHRPGHHHHHHHHRRRSSSSSGDAQRAAAGGGGGGPGGGSPSPPAPLVRTAAPPPAAGLPFPDPAAARAAASPAPPAAAAADPRRRKLSASPPPAFFCPLRVFVLAHQASFLVSGIIQTLGSQWLYYQGAANPASMLTGFVQYLGMALVVFVPSRVGTPPGSHAEYIPLAKVADGDEVLDADGALRRSLSPDSIMRPEPPPSKRRQILSGGGFFRRSWDAFARAALIRANEEDTLRLADVLKLAAMDVAACALITVGLFYVGSGLYQVIYSSIVAFTALFSRYFLGKSLNAMQWTSIIVITSGLAMSAQGAREDDHAVAENASKAAAAAVVDSVNVQPAEPRSTLGALLVLAATFLYAGIYTFNDLVLNKGPTPPLPEKVCVAVGLSTTAISGAYVLAFTLPRFRALVADALVPASSPARVAAAYAALALASTAHNASFFVLIRHTGGVSTGVMQSLRAVAVFGLSHLWFCPSDTAQCLNVPKALSAALVACGVLLYSFASAAGPRANPANAPGRHPA